MNINPTLIHGWSSGPQVFAPLISNDKEANRPSFKHIKQADQFLPAVQAVIPDSAVIIGWSMGALLAAQAALERQPKALILIGGTPKFCNTDRRKGWPERIIRRMQQRLTDDPNATLLQFGRQIFAPNEDNARDEYLLNFCTLERTDFSADGLRAGLDYLIQTDLTESLAELPCPTLWIHGAEDQVCPAAALDNLPDTHRTVIMPDTGHLPFWTRTGEVKWLIEDFVHAATH